MVQDMKKDIKNSRLKSTNLKKQNPSSIKPPKMGLSSLSKSSDSEVEDLFASPTNQK
jgi:hypothetical protein